MSRLSVVIPTRNRPRLLGEALECLLERTGPHVEVVVVDDGSDLDLTPVVAGAEAGRRRVKLVRQAHAGASAARNRGTSEASGDVLAFVDDDVLVSETWAESVLRGLEQLGTEALTGPVGLRLDRPAPRWLTPELRAYLSEQQIDGAARTLPAGFVPHGANCILTRQALEACGGWGTGFRHERARSAVPVVANEEVDLFDRFADHGLRVGWWPQASVEHQVGADRVDPAYLAERAYTQGVGDSHRHAEGRWRQVVRGARVLPIAAKGVTRGTGLVNARVWLAYCRGRYAGTRSRGPVQKDPARTSSMCVH